MAHIVGRDNDTKAARVPSKLSEQEKADFAELIEKRNEYINLILLCRNCHKQIDDLPKEYSVATLLSLKRDHERWIEENVPTFDRALQRDREIYAEIIDHWVDEAMIDEWVLWTSWVFGYGGGALTCEAEAKLEHVNESLLVRVWPGRYLELEAALINFRRVLNDFLTTFHKMSEKQGDAYATRKIYQSIYGADYDESRCQALLRAYDSLRGGACQRSGHRDD